MVGSIMFIVMAATGMVLFGFKIPETLVVTICCAVVERLTQQWDNLCVVITGSVITKLLE